MVRTLLIATALTLSTAPLVFSEDREDPPPPAGSLQLDREGRVEELLSGRFRQQRWTYRVVPEVRGVRESWTCPADGDPSSLRRSDACDVGRELSLMPPCTRPEDCQAFDLWSSRVGPPSVEQALPPAADRIPAVALTRPARVATATGSEDEPE